MTSHWSTYQMPPLHYLCSSATGYEPLEGAGGPSGRARKVPAPRTPMGSAAPVGKIVGAFQFESASWQS